MTADSSSQILATAHCLCGAITLNMTANEKWCAHCHCRMCRRQHGAGYVTWVGFHRQDVHIDDPNGQLTWHQSSPGARRGFCKTCGSSLLFESSRWAGETHVALGCIDEPHSYAPKAHAFFDTHVEWMAIDESLTVV